MAMDFINPSLPYIMQNLSASQASTKGLMITYLLAMSLTQLFYGSYSDNHGRRLAIFLAFAIAILGFLLSAESKSIEMLYFARFITAIGMAGTPVIARALIVDVCHDEKSLRKAFSYFAMFSQVSPALAPFFGGVIQHYASWRISFITLAAINLAVVLFLYKFMPESHQIPLVQKKLRQQLVVYYQLIKMSRFMVFSLLSSLIMTFTLGYYSLMPFIFHSMGVSAMMNGLMCIPYAIGLLSGAFAMSTIFNRFDSEKTFATILFFYLFFFIAMIGITLFYQNLLITGVIATIVGFLCGIAAPLSLTLAMQGFEINRGAGSAMQACIRYFFTGFVLLLCNFIELHQLYQLLFIFLSISLLMIVLYRYASL